MSIVGLVLAVSIPRFTALRDGWSVRAALAELGGSFSLARQTAIVRRMPVAVVLDTAAGAVEVRSIAGTVRRSVLSASYGVRLGSTRDSATFDGKGLGVGLSNLTVTVRRGGAIDTLTLSRLGRTRW